MAEQHFAEINSITGVEEWNSSINPSVNSKTLTIPTKNKYLDRNIKITLNGDSNLIAENIKNGITIFGVTGTHSGENHDIFTPNPIYFQTTASGATNPTAVIPANQYTTSEYYLIEGRVGNISGGELTGNNLILSDSDTSGISITREAANYSLIKQGWVSSAGTGLGTEVQYLTEVTIPNDKNFKVITELSGGNLTAKAYSYEEGRNVEAIIIREGTWSLIPQLSHSQPDLDCPDDLDFDETINLSSSQQIYPIAGVNIDIYSADSSFYYPETLIESGFVPRCAIKSLKITPPTSSDNIKQFTLTVPNGSTTDFIDFIFKIDSSGNVWVETPVKEIVFDEPIIEEGSFEAMG